MEPMKLITTRFEVLTALLLKIEVFWDVTLHHWVAVPDIPKQYSAFKMLRSTHKMKQRHIPDDLNLQLLIVKL
jgi:hypothetical protein